MVKVITYGTYDMLHYGHIRLLERAKELGDYLIVGVTSDDYDKVRGKINNQQSLMDRVAAVKETGLADEIIIEEYEGQKIDDIKRLGIDIFTVGSDWTGYFDYLNEFCKVVYLPRTEGISSSQIRTVKRQINIGFVGDQETRILEKFYNECRFVNGLDVSGICTSNRAIRQILDDQEVYVTESYEELLDRCDAVFILSHPKEHYKQVKQALEKGRHVLCEAPVALSAKEFHELEKTANTHHVVLMDSIKTAYSTAYYRLLLLVKSGKIGEVVSINATCTSIQELSDQSWNSICSWGPTALLPVFQLLGTEYKEIDIISRLSEQNKEVDLFSKINLLYAHGMGEVTVGRGIKSEGELIISGTKGYIYVPAPWWKTDYFEVRYENPADTQRYYYHLEGEGIRYELVDFVKTINSGNSSEYIGFDVSSRICEVMRLFFARERAKEI